MRIELCWKSPRTFEWHRPPEGPAIKCFVEAVPSLPELVRPMPRNSNDCLRGGQWDCSGNWQFGAGQLYGNGLGVDVACGPSDGFVPEIRTDLREAVDGTSLNELELTA